MTQRATTSLSLHYHVKPGQKEALLVEIRGILDRCAKEPEFIMAIIHEPPELGRVAGGRRPEQRRPMVRPEGACRQHERHVLHSEAPERVAPTEQTQGELA